MDAGALGGLCCSSRDQFWRLTAGFRKRGLSRATGSERFRQTLERIWAKGS